MSTAARPRQLNVDELRRLNWLLGGVMALVSLWTVFFLDIEALGLVGFAGAMILAALVWPGLPDRVPPLLWRLAVPAIIVTMAADFYFSPDTLPVLIRLAILLVLYRAVSYRRKREDLQLIVLCLFLIVVAGVLTVSLGFAFLLLTFTACALGFLFCINLIAASETGEARAPGAETAWTRLVWRGFFARLRAVADWRLLTFASVLFALVVGMSGVLFLVIPRFEVATGFFLDRYITRKSRTGFTETVRFGSVSELINDDSVAMRVDLTDSRSLRGTPYWRLVVLDEYTKDGFKVSAGLKNELLLTQSLRQTLRGRNVPIPQSRTEGGIWTFYVEPGVSRFLPLPGTFASLRLREGVPLQASMLQSQNRATAVTPPLEGVRIVALRTEAMTMTAYQLDGVEMDRTISDPGFALLLRRNRTPATRGENEVPRYDPRLTLAGPEGPANTGTLQRVVAEITGGATLPAEEFARRATAWLQTRHAYSLSVKLPAGPGKDDIVRWVDSNEPGFCEYFAAGFTVLARAAGYPARVVAGFKGGMLNGFENYYMVRNSQAHAWAEIYDGRQLWLRVDPTAGTVATAEETRVQAVAQEQDSSWSARVDSLRVLWYRRIVNFDSRTQVQMLEQVKTFTTDSGQALRARFEDMTKWFKTWLLQPWNMARIARLAGWLAAVAAAAWALGWLARRAWQRWQFWRKPMEFDPVRRMAGRQLARLRELDAERKAADRPSPRLRTAGGEHLIHAVVGDLQRLRYGRRETWPEPHGVFRRAQQARRAVKRAGGAPTAS